MKINFKLLLAAFLTAGLIPGAMAQVTVVKQDGKKIYLDTSTLNRNISVGETFKLIIGQEKLTNPKTGKELGFIYHYSEEGKIIEVQPLYAIGELPQATQYKIGQQAVITPARQTAVVSAPAASALEEQKAQTAASAPSAAAPALVANRKIKTYPVLEYEIISAVKADLNAFPGEEIAALDSKGQLRVYTEENNQLKQIAAYSFSANQTPLTLSALDIMHTGYAQLFAVVYDAAKPQITTLVLDATDKDIQKRDTLPYFVKEWGCAADKKLYAQKPFTQGSKGGDVRLLEYAKDKFSLGEKVFGSRGNWLSGMNWYPVQNAETFNPIFTFSNGELRVRLANGKYVQSPSLFAATPNRVKYKQDIISFYPSVQVYGPAGKAVLAAVQNVAKFGILSESFGSYKSSKIHFLTYENGILDVRESIDLNGVLYDTNCTAEGILAPQVVSGEQTVLTEIYR